MSTTNIIRRLILHKSSEMQIQWKVRCLDNKLNTIVRIDLCSPKPIWLISTTTHAKRTVTNRNKVNSVENLRVISEKSYLKYISRLWRLLNFLKIKNRSKLDNYWKSGLHFNPCEISMPFDIKTLNCWKINWDGQSMADPMDKWMTYRNQKPKNNGQILPITFLTWLLALMA